MMLFVLSVVFVLLLSIFVARETRQDRTIVFLILLILFSAMKFKKQMKMDERKFWANQHVEFAALHLRMHPELQRQGVNASA